MYFGNISVIFINEIHIAPVFNVLVIRKKLFELHIERIKKGIIFIETLKIIMIHRKKINLALCIVVIKNLEILLILNKNYCVVYDLIYNLSELEFINFYPKFMSNVMSICEEYKVD